LKPRKLRNRYVVFRFKGDPDTVYATLRSRLSYPHFLKPISHSGEVGVFRCAHLDLELVKKELAGMGAQVRGVSGTLRKARQKFLCG